MDKLFRTRGMSKHVNLCVEFYSAIGAAISIRQISIVADGHGRTSSTYAICFQTYLADVFLRTCCCVNRTICMMYQASFIRIYLPSGLLLCLNLPISLLATFVRSISYPFHLTFATSCVFIVFKCISTPVTPRHLTRLHVFFLLTLHFFPFTPTCVHGYIIVVDDLSPLSFDSREAMEARVLLPSKRPLDGASSAAVAAAAGTRHSRPIQGGRGKLYRAGLRRCTGCCYTK